MAICVLKLFDIQFVKFIVVTFIFRSSRPELFLRKGVLKIYSKFTGVFSCKFAAYFQNTFSLEHFWVAASVSYCSVYFEIYLSFLIKYLSYPLFSYMTKNLNISRTKRAFKIKYSCPEIVSDLQMPL